MCHFLLIKHLVLYFWIFQVVPSKNSPPKLPGFFLTSVRLCFWPVITSWCVIGMWCGRKQNCVCSCCSNHGCFVYSRPSIQHIFNHPIIWGEEYKLPTIFVEVGNIWLILRELNCNDWLFVLHNVFASFTYILNDERSVVLCAAYVVFLDHGLHKYAFCGRMCTHFL